MNKLLTLIVPTYNKEAFLENCVRSVTDTEWDEALEIIIVNDGSTDHTLSVARKLQHDYPGIVEVIDKENGNYGSAVNAALPAARGKYVRLLDADDQYYKDGFCRLMALLVRTNCDMYVNNYAVYEGVGRIRTEIYPWNGEYNKEYTLDEVFTRIADDQRPLLMYNLTYRTALLQQNGYRQTEGVSYTDTEWMFYPLFHIHTVMFTDAVVYKYYLGIPGQTMSPENYIKGTPAFIPLVLKMQRYYTAFARQHPVSRAFHYYIAWHLFFGWYRRIFNISLLFLDEELYDCRRLKEVDESLNTLDKELSRYVAGRCKSHHVKYMKYWRLVHRRIPLWLRRYLIPRTEIV